MSDFNKWFDSEYPSLSTNLDNYFCKITREYSNDAWNHQQEKIDELQKELQLSQTEIKSLVSRTGIDHKKIESLLNSTNELQSKLTQAYEDIETFATAHEALSKKVDLDGALIQTQQAANKSLIEERDELQKRVDRITYLLPGLKAENELWGCDQVEVQIELLEQALKGDHA